MNYFSIENCTGYFKTFSFVHNGKTLSDAPFCGMTLKKAGSMRFRWNETNPNRDNILASLVKDLALKNPEAVQIAPVELIHSQTVYKADSFEDVKNLTGDGIVSNKDNLMAVVTVADCMPLYVYDKETRAFAIVHSGWKGTGIVVNAINKMMEEYGSKKENICVILGPHIHKCCYIVNQERAEYFSKNFTPECVTPLEEGIKIDWNNGEGQLYRLSLQDANLAALKKGGIREENINVCTDCTCCNPIFGSNRRETAEGMTFTVQAAFIVRQDLQQIPVLV